MRDAAKTTDPSVRRRAMRAIIAFGLVSLLADIVYEGARSIIGPYLLTVGASAAAVGLVSGMGEFAGYALRWVTGLVADRTGGYWPMTIAGYTMTILAVPLLGWVGRVDLALGLVVAERLGKAIRSPARDALLAEAAGPLGRGWGFGIHEALDQTGAVVGPLLLALVLSIRQSDYRLAFTILLVPGVLALIALFLAHRSMPQRNEPGAVNDTAPVAHGGGHIGLYLGFVAFAAVGFAPFPLIAFHLSSHAVVGDAQIPLLFAVAMAVDAGTALLSGRFYDRTGLRVLLAIPLLGALTVLAFTTIGWIVWPAMAAWGGVMGIQESTLRAAVGDLAPSANRATAYGGFNTAYGIALLAGGVVLGLLYDRSLAALVVFVIAAQAAAAMVLRQVVRFQPQSTGGEA